jgi:hypothetical protein
MLYNKLLISESDKTHILNLYGVSSVKDTIVITEWLSPDEKYCIFLDELYDIQNKTKIGNIWENFDNFKFFLTHSFKVATNVPKQIKENVLNSLKSFVITESTQNMSTLKPYIKELLEEGILKNVADWGKETVSSAVSGVSDFVKTSWDGLKKLGIAISEGDWNRIVDLLKKGALYVARKIRGALYHPIGIVLDAILMASGVGVTLKMLPWAIVVGLDVYEFMTGKYEDTELSTGWRLLFFATDVMGLVFAGASAKVAKNMVTGLITKYGKTSEAVSQAVKNSKKLTTFLETIQSSSSKVVGLMEKALVHLKTKSPMFYKFLSGVMGGLTTVLNKLINLIGSILKGAGKVLSAPGKLTSKLGGGTKTSAAANTLVPVAGIGVYGKHKEEEYEDALLSSLKNSNIESVYNYDDI